MKQVEHMTGLNPEKDNSRCIYPFHAFRRSFEGDAGLPKFIILSILSALLLVSCGESSKIRISGEIEDGRGEWIYLDRLELAGPRPVDSLRIKRAGQFSFTARMAYPGFFRLRLDDRNFITLLAEPGERVNVRAKASNLAGTYQVSGSEGSELLKKLNDRLSETKRKLEPLVKEIISLEEGPEFERQEARINEELNEIIREQRNFSIAFILDNMESLAAITALYQQIDDENYVLNQTRDIQFLKIVAESLVKKYPDSPHVKALVIDAENQERRYEHYRFSVMAEQRGEVIDTYPDIAMPGIDGDTVRLHSLQEKYILLLFGSSLSESSVRLSHDLIPLHRAYHSKGFQIYHISVERDRDEWLRTIEFSELPWVHVAHIGEGSFRAAQLYNVQQIPANYLLHRDAGIVARDITAPELRRRLARGLD